jgi:hypothetical protein
VIPEKQRLACISLLGKEYAEAIAYYAGKLHDEVIMDIRLRDPKIKMIQARVHHPLKKSNWLQ